MKKCLVALTGILLLALFVPTASASFVYCDSAGSASGTATLSATLTCSSLLPITIPGGYHLTDIQIQLYDDASLPFSTSSVIQWTWTGLSITGTGLTGVTTGTLVNTETAQNAGNFNPCAFVSSSYASTVGCTGNAGSTVITIPTLGSSITGLTINVSSLSTGGDPGVRVGTGTQGGGNATAELLVSYDYASNVPEPATLSLMGGALLGIGLFAKKLARR